MFAAISRHATQLANAIQHSQAAETTRYAEAAENRYPHQRKETPSIQGSPYQYMGSEGAARIAILPPALGSHGGGSA